MEKLRDQIAQFVNWDDDKKSDALFKLPNLTKEQVASWTGLADAVLQPILEKLIAGIQQPTIPIVAEREQTAQFLIENIPPPSQFAQNNKGLVYSWSNRKMMKVLQKMRAHRPARLEGDGDILPLPVTLLDKILGQVEEDCAYGTPEAEDTEAAQELILSMSDSLGSEQDRMNAFWSWAADTFGVHLAQHKTERMETDGSALLDTSLGLVIYANLEVKQEIGAGGGDPRIHNCSYATLHFCHASSKDLRALCRCPVLLMELAGPNLSLSGFAFGQHACSDQLSQSVCLLWQPNSELMIGVARVVYAIRRAWPALKAFYNDLGNQPRPAEPDEQLVFPYQCTFNSLEGVQDFTYIKRISSYTFHAVADGASLFQSTKPQLFIKFCKRYSVPAHEALQAKGFAPRLFGCERLPGPWFMVVMEYLPCARLWDHLDTMEMPRDKLRQAVEALHAADFVHGDLRSCNVLVDIEQVYLTDLEWAGKVGEAKYPFFMSHNIAWPPGARDNWPITKEHDVYWMDHLLSK
ncbi:hypothetical protein COCOBI_18-0020 [Coccomyxa sp. Obi]|nr:hypothetical protein COCOBI_18-0020 [Coccomyxa sp. Obi]